MESQGTFKVPKVLAASESRESGGFPNDRDLANVVFSYGNKFEMGESVLVPRSRGGFVYGTISKSSKKSPCFINPAENHDYIEWRVEYPNLQGKPMFKCMPTILIGKIPPSGKSKQSIALSREQTRNLGDMASARDLNNVNFNRMNRFSIGEIVLVGRSSGGFTYGEILSPLVNKVACLLPLDKEQRHGVNGWKIALDAKKTMKKELPPNFIGKLPLCGATIEIPEPTIEKPKEKSREPRKKKTKKKNMNQRFAEMENSITPASDVATISANLKDLNIDSDKQNQSSEDDEDSEEDESSEEILFRPPGYVEPETKVEEPKSNGGMFKLPANLVPEAPKQPKPKCLVVIDAPNVARKHGNKLFSTKGISICAEYWQQRGHEVVAFLPEHYVSSKPTAGNTITLDQYFPKVDDMGLIEKLERAGILFYTPPQDYDDSYCIQHAKTNNGVIVTNDLYRDHIEKTPDNMKRKERNWIRNHCISFTFVKDQFLPNPDFKFPKICGS